MKFIITKDQVEKISLLLFRNSTQKVREILSELPEVEPNTLREDIERLIRNNGRSNMISIDELKEVLGE